MPLLNLDVDLLVEVADGAGAYFGSPQVSVMSSMRRTKTPARYISICKKNRHTRKGATEATPFLVNLW